MKSVMWWAGAGSTAELRDVWEAGAFHLERLQAAEDCVSAEQAVQASRQAPAWTLPFTPAWTPEAKLTVSHTVHMHPAFLWVVLLIWAHESCLLR